ncbi:ABC transporter ATP-binding protein [Spirochaeta dissipatitropha]
MPKAVIETQDLNKIFRIRSRRQSGIRQFFAPQFDELQAVRDLNLRIEQGEVVAFLGPNGAGKSTSIKMLTGILEPSSGSLHVLGRNPHKDRKELVFRIGTVFGQKSQLWFHLPPSDSFTLLREIYEIPMTDYRRRRDELVDRFHLGSFYNTPVRKLSLGQRVRCEIAASFLHAPEILFLDEPTIGLDVVVKQEIRSLLTELNHERGTTILLTSHDIGDIEKICKRAVIIHHGQTIVDEPVRQLKKQALAKKCVSVRYNTAVDFSRLQELSIDGLRKLSSDSSAARFEVNMHRRSFADLLQQLAVLGELADVSIEDEPLENLIAEIFQTSDPGVQT